MSSTDTLACRLCGAPAALQFRQALLNHQVSYYDCPSCGYVQTETPFWLEQAYQSAINDVDTGILWRNQLNARRVVMTLQALGRLHGKVVDHAGGYGILVRMLRDLGVDARWRDKYCANLLAKGFEDDDASADLVTAFEVFEHLEHPLQELQELLQRSPAVLISTQLVTTQEPPARDWWYLGPEHGQHIGFFRERSLRHMAQQLGCEVATDGSSLHLFSRTSIPRWWHPLQRLHFAARLTARIGRLSSKTMSDFNHLRSNTL